jgi:uncharacterized membrane protein YdbT with pleckstrin-like domain
MNQLDPKAVWQFFIYYLFVAFFVLFMFSFFFLGFTANISPEKQWTISGLSWLVILSIFMLIWIILAYVLAKLKYHFYRYQLADIDFRKEYGVIWKKYVSIPYDRIQNIDIYRGILDRLFGLSRLYVQTAGMSVAPGRYGSKIAAAEGQLPGLSREVAEQLRDELIQRTRQVKHQEF